MKSSLFQECSRAALAFLVALAAGHADRAIAAPEFVVRDSGRQVAQYSKLFWLDNQRVLFQSPDGIAWKRDDGFEQASYRLYVWNTATGVIEARNIVGGGLCYKDGFVRYWRWKKNDGTVQTESEWLAGEFESESVVDAKVTDPKNFNWETCKPYSELPPRPDWAKGLAIRILRPEHGLLVLGSSALTESMKNSTISFCPEGKKEHCFETPLRRREATGFAWYGFEGAYFVSSEYFFKDSRHPAGGYTRSPWPQGEKRPVWWLRPDGKINSILLPAGPWAGGGSISFHPSRRGVLVRSHNLGARGVGNAGVYLVDGERFSRLVSAYVEEPTVSPDGCRLAYSHDPYDTYARSARIERITVRVIELCPGR